MEEGKSEVRILDRGLAFLLDDEPKHINERAGRKNIQFRETSQVIDFPCDLFFTGFGLGGYKPKSYALGDAKKLIDLSPKISSNLTTGQARQLLDDEPKHINERAGRKNIQFR
ncbi:hypothetical protein SAMN05660964_03556, partial [Thiothrix caldifontis]